MFVVSGFLAFGLVSRATNYRGPDFDPVLDLGTASVIGLAWKESGQIIAYLLRSILGRLGIREGPNGHLVDDPRSDGDHDAD